MAATKVLDFLEQKQITIGFWRVFDRKLLLAPIVVQKFQNCPIPKCTMKSQFYWIKRVRKMYWFLLPLVQRNRDSIVYMSLWKKRITKSWSYYVRRSKYNIKNESMFLLHKIQWNHTFCCAFFSLKTIQQKRDFIIHFATKSNFRCTFFFKKKCNHNGVKILLCNNFVIQQNCDFIIWKRKKKYLNNKDIQEWRKGKRKWMNEDGEKGKR